MGLGEIHEEVLSRSMQDFAADFENMVSRHLRKVVKRKTMSEDMLYILDDELVEIEMYREIATYTFYGAKRLGLPPERTG